MKDKRTGSKLYPIISGRQRGLWASGMRMLLGGMSGLYYSSYKRRHNKHIKMEKFEAGAPVISVGNITVGGTGKTPVCRYLARRLEDQGMKVGIASRGYGREGGGTVVLNPGDRIADWHHCGDEPLLFLRGSKNTTVAIDVDRTNAVDVLVKDCGCDVILLDDGFQFVSLQRNVDIVVIDAMNPFGFGKLIPAGLLREPVSSLERADLFWLAKTESIPPEHRDMLIENLKQEFPNKPIIESVYRPRRFVDLKNPEKMIEPSEMAGKYSVAMSGIGNPAAFENLVASVCVRPPIPFRFTDHHPFGGSDLEEVEDMAVRAEVDAIITTEKDAVRIPGFFYPRCKWWVLEIEVTITGRHGPEDAFPELPGLL